MFIRAHTEYIELYDYDRIHVFKAANVVQEYNTKYIYMLKLDLAGDFLLIRTRMY